MDGIEFSKAVGAVSVKSCLTTESCVSLPYNFLCDDDDSIGLLLVHKGAPLSFDESFVGRTKSAACVETEFTNDVEDKVLKKLEVSGALQSFRNLLPGSRLTRFMLLTLLLFPTSNPVHFCC